MAIRGQGEALPTFWPAQGDGEMWDVLFPKRGLFLSVIETACEISKTLSKFSEMGCDFTKTGCKISKTGSKFTEI